MRVASEDLPVRLERGLAPLYVVHGEEPLGVLESCDAIRAAARAAGYTVRELLIAEVGFDWGRLAMSAASLSLFGERQILEVRVPSGRPGVDGARALEAFAAAPPPDRISLVVLGEVERASRKSVWFTALERHALLVESSPVARARLPEWIGARLAGRRLRASREALAFIADRVEGNLLAARQEVEKLALLCPPGEVTLDDVRAAITDVSRFAIADLGDAILARDAARIARVMDGLRAEAEALPLVLWAITRELRGLLAVAAAQAGRAPVSSALQRDAQLWGARQGQVERAAGGRDPRQLAGVLRQAAGFDRTFKGLAPGDAWDAALQLALAAAGRSAVGTGLQ